MSATGRGERRGGPDDVFYTPSWVVDRLLEAWTPREGMLLEPAAGEGAIIRALRDNPRPSGVEGWVAVECRATCAKPLAEAVGLSERVHIADFLEWEPPVDVASRVTTVLTNPPFYLCSEFIRRSAELFPDADLVFLVRLGFLSSSDRVPLWRDLGTPDVFVLPNRPSFTSDGRTDTSDYAWLAFPGEEKRTEGVFRVLEETPLEARRPRRKAA